MKKWRETLRGQWGKAFLWEGIALCGTATVLLTALVMPRITPNRLVAIGVALGVDWLVLSPVRWGRRLWYRRLAAGESPDGCGQYAWRHYFSALLWRGWLYLLRGTSLMMVGLPLIVLRQTAAILRTHVPSVMVDGALLACILAAVACLALVPLGIPLLIGWWPLPELMANSGSFWMALRRCYTLMKRRRGKALAFWGRGIGWGLLGLVPLLGLPARIRWHLHRAQWIVVCEAANLPPMRDGVRLYLPHKASEQP